MSSRRDEYSSRHVQDRSPKSGRHENHHQHRKSKISHEEKLQRGIEQTKNRLKSSLSSAISDSLTSSTDAYPRRIAMVDYPTDIADSVARQAAIDRIEEAGFQPTTFKSDADSSRKKILAGTSKHEKEATIEHDRAMFGPMWASKEIQKKHATKHQNAKLINMKADSNNMPQGHLEQTPTVSKFPLAHESLSEDPEIRNQRWLKLFRERRKLALEGNL